MLWPIDMTVVPFRRRRPGKRFAQPVEPPPALAREPRRRPMPVDPDDDRLRMLQNCAALVVVVVLLVLGWWLIERLDRYSRTMACIESGQRACLKIDVDQLPRR